MKAVANHYKVMIVAFLPIILIGKPDIFCTHTSP